MHMQGNTLAIQYLAICTHHTRQVIEENINMGAHPDDAKDLVSSRWWSEGKGFERKG